MILSNLNWLSSLRWLNTIFQRRFELGVPACEVRGVWRIAFQLTYDDSCSRTEAVFNFQHQILNNNNFNRWDIRE